MAILKVMRGAYKNEAATENLINYILNPQKVPGNYYGGQGLSLLNPQMCIQIVKDVFCHNTGKQMEHFVLSFADKESRIISLDQALVLAYDICDFFAGRQIVFAVHQNGEQEIYEDERLHIHFVMSTTNIHSGYKERIDFMNVYSFKAHIEALLWNAGVAESVKLVF